MPHTGHHNSTPSITKVKVNASLNVLSVVAATRLYNLLWTKCRLFNLHYFKTFITIKANISYRVTSDHWMQPFARRSPTKCMLPRRDWMPIGLHKGGKYFDWFTEIAATQQCYVILKTAVDFSIPVHVGEAWWNLCNNM